MAQIALMIPTNDAATSWINGVCEIAGYETHIPLESVSYGIECSATFSQMGRRTTDEPEVSEVTITRKADLSTNDITRKTLQQHVNTAPWVIYFFRALGGGPEQDDTYHTRHLLYLTLSLADPLITSQNIDMGEKEMTETITVSASAMDWTYTAYDSDNTPLGHISFAFNSQSGTEAEEDC